jgi:hypothetical protein
MPMFDAIRGTPSVDGGGTLRYALISGEPMKRGAPFTIRLACSDGYKAAPHWHLTDESLVVLMCKGVDVQGGQSWMCKGVSPEIMYYLG